jgi:hypothetical protein
VPTHDELKTMVRNALVFDGHDCLDNILGALTRHRIVDPTDETRTRTLDVRGDYVWDADTIAVYRVDAFNVARQLEQTLDNYVYAHLETHAGSLEVAGWKKMSDSYCAAIAEGDNAAISRACSAAEKARVAQDMRHLDEIVKRNPHLLRARQAS